MLSKIWQMPPKRQSRKVSRLSSKKTKEIDVSDTFEKVKGTTGSAIDKAKEHLPSAQEAQEKAAQITETGRSILKSMVNKISK
jgi:hypothetical protein